MAAPDVARSRRPAHVALFDAGSLAAKGIKEQLVARSFPTASIRMFTSSTDPDANLTEYAGQAILVTRPDIDTLGDLDIAFLCGTRQEGETYLDWARKAGFVAIDLTRASSGADNVVPVNALVNPEAIVGRAGVIATPHPVSQLLSTLLAPVRRHCALEEAVVVVLQPASERGEPGIDELYQQSLSLMNFSEMPKEIFGRQLAFNLIPGHLAEEARTVSATRADIEREVQRITGGDYALAVQTIQAPVFHGHAAMAHVALGRGKGREDLLAALRGMADISLGQRGDAATPIERAGKSGLLVTGVVPGLNESSFWIWAVADDLAGGTSLNAVRIAEKLLERGPREGRA
jgi:aspartate-semialdehyde dehydrogenase